MENTVKPAIIRPPKPPSKNQLMMDRLKASIEAEKNKPTKKEVQSKVAASIRVVHTSLNDENVGNFNESMGLNKERKIDKCMFLFILYKILFNFSFTCL